MTILVVRGYSAVSKDAACALVGSVPWDLEASSLAEVYWRCQSARDEGNVPPFDVVQRWRNSEHDRALDLWLEQLEQPRVSIDLLTALRPVLKEWVRRKSGALTFRLTQILTGHGCFGRYLCEVVKREETSACHHCNEICDTAQHTISTFPAWDNQRSEMKNIIGQDTTLPVLVYAMLESQDKWRAVEHFADEVISTKEEAERARERAARLGSLRSRRPRRRRAINHDDPNVPP
ncbi:uncharacterized protein LOC121737396 [Aricia agestis]|uniref:uncharacterized protein LOC121737396 n=1 Tax=Aricia agestis TaxID=91739 RepID=UPI001C2082B8|nr:uncharacterized protein LOC121737396 [Aricia agestis]